MDPQVIVSNWHPQVVVVGNSLAHDIGTQAIAGVISGVVVGVVLLYSQHRIEKWQERERVQREARRELLAAAIKMRQLVSWTFVGTGSKERVADGWNQVQRAAADWAAIEEARDFSDDLLKVSRKAREELSQDLLAIVAKSPLSTGEDESPENRDRWLAIGNRRRLEPLEPLIALCK